MKVQLQPEGTLCRRVHPRKVMTPPDGCWEGIWAQEGKIMLYIPETSRLLSAGHSNSLGKDFKTRNV